MQTFKLLQGVGGASCHGNIYAVRPIEAYRNKCPYISTNIHPLKTLYSLEFSITIKLGYQNISICLVHIITYGYIRIAENANTNI
jgi:hypothetical protein